ncbi:MAG: DNA-3-methyladenine glycosylase I [Candidatus Tectimicrobiota bacterium]
MPPGVTAQRCPWCGDDPVYVAYHDHEWGVPQHDDRQLFAMLILDGAQAGLSWITILRKRDNYRRAFDDFDPERMARYGPHDVARLLGDAGIVRNRLKIAAAIGNAQSYLRVRDEFGSLDRFLWRYVDGVPRHNAWTSITQIPARTPESDLLSRDLQKKGFKFVGSTICYAFMQAAGMVNDHLVHCFRYQEVQQQAPH